MIDEKRIGEIKKQLAECCCTNVVYKDEADELIRLSRLGIWATEHAVPVLQENASRGHKLAIKALAALPKEDE